MTHIRDISRFVQLRVHFFHQSQLNVLLLAKAVYNVRELNEFAVAMNIVLLSSNFQHIVIDVTVVRRLRGRRGEGGEGRGGEEEGRGEEGRGGGEREEERKERKKDEDNQKILLKWLTSAGTFQ